MKTTINRHELHLLDRLATAVQEQRLATWMTGEAMQSILLIDEEADPDAHACLASYVMDGREIPLEDLLAELGVVIDHSEGSEHGREQQN